MIEIIRALTRAIQRINEMQNPDRAEKAQLMEELKAAEDILYGRKGVTQ